MRVEPVAKLLPTLLPEVIAAVEAASSVILAIYNTAFSKFDLGKAAALSIVLLVSLVVINGIQLLVLRRREEQ